MGFKKEYESNRIRRFNYDLRLYVNEVREYKRPNLPDGPDFVAVLFHHSAMDNDEWLVRSFSVKDNVFTFVTGPGHASGRNLYQDESEAEKEFKRFGGKVLKETRNKYSEKFRSMIESVDPRDVIKIITEASESSDYSKFEPNLKQMSISGKSFLGTKNLIKNR